MKDSFLAAIILVAFFLWQLVILFGIWGGLPQGAYWKAVACQERIASVEGRAEAFYNMIVDNKNEEGMYRVEQAKINVEQARQIEIIRNQLAQLKL